MTARRLRVLEMFEAADGGVPEHVRRLAEGLEARGQSVTVAGPPTTGLRAELERVAEEFVAIPITGSMASPVTDTRTLAAAVRLMRDRPFDLVHVHGLKPALVGRAVAIARGVPVIYTPHCFIYRNQSLRPRRSSRVRGRVLLAIERLLGRRTAAVVGVAAEERDAAVRDGLVPASRARVVLNGVDPEIGAAPRAELKRARGEGPLFGLVAGLRDQKGLPTLLEALELLGARGKAVRFAIVGDGPLAEEVAERVASGPLAETTTVLPFGGRVEPNLAALDVFVLPSYWEGLPIAVLEAMALGLPVIASAVGGTPEAVEAGVTGLLVPPSDPAALAAAIEELAGDPSRRTRMGAAGRERVAERFRIDRMVDEVLALYLEVAGESAASGVLARVDA